MNTLLITYDLNKAGQNYASLLRQIKDMGAWWHHLDSTWLVRTMYTPVEARNMLLNSIDINDELLIIDVTGDAAAWTFPSTRGGQWIIDSL